MSTYRIKEEYLSTYDHQIRKVYSVERRFLWLWFLPILLYPSTFPMYEQAIEFINQRQGKLLYIC